MNSRTPMPLEGRKSARPDPRIRPGWQEVEDRGIFFGPKSISTRFHFASKVKPQKSKGQNEEIKQSPETADNRPRSKAQEGREGRLGKCQRERQHYSAAVGSARSQVIRLAAPMGKAFVMTSRTPMRWAES